MNMKKRIKALVLTAALLSQSVSAGAFWDVPVEHESYDDISLISSLGVIAGMGDGSFAPDSNVTRADFMIMVDKAFKLKDGTGKTFADVTPDNYFYESVMAAANAGVISGRDENNFVPYDNVTMQEAAKICVASCETDGTVMPVSKDPLSLTTDLWAKNYCDKAATANIIDDSFDARKALTRAEAAEMICAAILYNRNKRDIDYERETLIVQKQRGNIFLDTDGYPEVEIQTGYPVVEYVLSDFWGNTVAHEYRKVMDGKLDLKFDGIDFGYYVLKVYATNEKQERKQLAKATLCYLKEFTPCNPLENPYAVNFGYDRQTSGWQADLVHEASLIGIGALRNDYNWTYVEKSPGVYTNYIESHVATSLANNMVNLANTGFRNILYSDGMRPHDDATRTAFANYIKSYYDFYGDDNPYTNTVEIYNEWWNSSTCFGSPAGSTDLSYLRELHEKIYEVVKKDYPNAKLQAMLANPQWMFKKDTDGTTMFDFNMSFIKEGIVHTVDELTIHFYPTYKNALEKLEFNENGHLMDVPEIIIGDGMKYLDEQMTEHNGVSINDIPWTVTETGWYVDYKEFTERNQGTFYPRIMMSFLKEGAKRIYTYDFLCDGKVKDNKEHNYGILNALHSDYGTYAPRPAYVTYGVNSRMIGNKKIVNREERDNVYAYEISDGTKVFHTVKYAPVTLALETDEALQITDIMGHTRKFVPYNGKVYLTVSEDMIYVKGNVKSWSITEDMKFDEKTFPVMGSDFSLSADVNAFGIPEMTFEVNGKDYTADDILVPASYETDERTVKIFAKVNGEYVGAFDKVIKMANKYELITSFDLLSNNGEYTPVINAKIKNRSDKDIYINAINYTANGEERTHQVNEVLKAKQELDVEIKPENLLLYTNYNFSFKLVADEELSPYVDNENRYAYAPLVKKTMTIDGVIDEGLTEKVNMTDSYQLLDEGTDEWLGKTDLDGNVWTSYDDDNLYVAIEIIDDIHRSSKSDDMSWQSDCIQFAMFHDLYENNDLSYDYVVSGTDSYNEMVFYLTEDMQKKIWRYNSITELKDNDSWDNITYEIKRDENNKTTVYEMAFPWEELLIDPEDISYYSFEIAVTDSDTGLRDHGYYLTGDAIVMTKNRYNYLKYTLIK